VEANLERTLVLIKPDGVQRGLIGEITRRLEQRGLKLTGAKLVHIEKDMAERHYEIHKGKAFYDGLIDYITSAPVMAMVWEGPQAIGAVRQTMGSTDPKKAEPGSVRHDFGLEIGRNLTHASDAPETAEHEITLWFSDDELVSWSKDMDRWILED
jgi:nucleoside-diphosphate kinase